MASSLSTPVNNLSERIQRIKIKCEHDDKKCETCGTTYEVYDSFLKYKNFRDDLMECKFYCCNKDYHKQFDEKFKE